MIIKRLEGYFTGFVNIHVEGYFIERFINMSRIQKIYLWDIEKKNDIYLTANIGIRDFKKLKKIAKKTKCKVGIDRKKGVPFFLHRYKKRKIFLIMMCLIILSLLILSRFVWNIEIKITGDTLQEEEILKSLNENGLFIGENKSSIDVKEIINNIRLARADIAWIGIELKGTNAIVEVVEAEEKPEIVNQDEYCNIVSDKEGKIVKINANTGTAMVKPGDVVKEGTLLIAGWMEGKYTGNRFVRATGEIEASVWYTEKATVDFKETKVEKTGNMEKKYAININNFRINLYKRLSNFEKYDTIYATKKLKLFSNFYIPVELIECNNSEIKEYEINYTEEEAKEEAKRRAEEKLNQKITNKDNINNVTVNYTIKDDAVEAEVTYEVFENIGTNEKIVY